VVERGPVVEPPRPPVRRHRGPSPRQVLLRRLVAVTFLFAVVGALGAGVIWAVGRVRAGDKPPPPVALPPPPKPFKILFPEGFTRAQMAQRITAVRGIARSRRHASVRLAAKPYLAATAASAIPASFAGDHRRRSLEGFLFPATYDFTKKTTSRQLVGRQLEAFKRSWAKLDLRYARSKNLTRYDVLIIASMIEKETLAPDERPLVSAVIYNRLHARMPLGIDATIRYALGVPPTKSLRVSQLNDPTPYNTRLHTGLPPTPIANPGLASMQAAAHPAPVKYLYFVRKPDKVHHFFTASYRAFQNYANSHGY
jgi:UPF0755 protein